MTDHIIQAYWLYTYFFFGGGGAWDKEAIPKIQPLKR